MTYSMAFSNRVPSRVWTSMLIAGMAGICSLPVAASENPYLPAHDHPYRHGAMPTREAHAAAQQWRTTHDKFAASGPNNQTLSYGGGVNGNGVINGAPKVYLVVYGSQWGTVGADMGNYLNLSNDSKGALPFLQQWYASVGMNNDGWSNTMMQYCDGANVAAGATQCPVNANHVQKPLSSALAGVWYDNTTAAPDQATASQIANEAIAAAAHFGNTTPQSNRNAQYVIMFPPGTHPDGFNTSTGNFCSWHDNTSDTAYLPGVSSSYGDLAFTNLPYVSDAGSSCGTGIANVHGALDAFSINAGRAYAETLTNPAPNHGWYNADSTSNYSGQEAGSECAWILSGQGAIQSVTFGTHTYAMQSIWSNDTNRCEISHPCVGNCVATCNATPVFQESVSCTAAGAPSAGGYAMAYVYTTYSGNSACSRSFAFYDTSQCGGTASLTSGIPVSGQSGAAGSRHLFTISVPAGRASLTIKTSGGSGDVDLYVQLGNDPTTSSYLKKSDGNTNVESITLSRPAAGTYHIMLAGYAAYSGVTLVATD